MISPDRNVCPHDSPQRRELWQLCRETRLSPAEGEWALDLLGDVSVIRQLVLFSTAMGISIAQAVRIAHDLTTA